MFCHEFIYKIKRVLRKKNDIFWVLAFPMVLSILFHAAFENINNTTENFHAIPVAICLYEGAAGDTFKEVADTLGKKGDDQFFDITYTDMNTAKKLLQDNSVYGIFSAGEDVTLTCMSTDSGNVNSTAAIQQSILNCFFQEYQANATAIADIAANNPEGLSDALSFMECNTSYKEALQLTDGNMDIMVQYFFNLIAMACLYTSFAGSDIAIKNQANLSDIGARKCTSPSHKFLAMSAELCGCLLTQFFCVSVNVLFQVYVLNVDFGASLPLLLLTAFIGCVVGVSFGFFVGSIGRIGENLKIGILICVSMVCCFLSGLMFQNMRAIIETYCPIINKINPAALISDCFHTLNIYGIGDRYTRNILSLLLISGIFLVGGCLMVRRKTYASL